MIVPRIIVFSSSATAIYELMITMMKKAPNANGPYSSVNIIVEEKRSQAQTLHPSPLLKLTRVLFWELLKKFSHRVLCPGYKFSKIRNECILSYSLILTSLYVSKSRDTATSSEGQTFYSIR